ncbi:unnamed protein product, partial [Musa hybrid cultivar]
GHGPIPGGRRRVQRSSANRSLLRQGASTISHTIPRIGRSGEGNSSLQARTTRSATAGRRGVG